VILKSITNAMVISTFVGAVVFVIVYLRRNWHSSAVGLNLMMFGLVIAIESGLGVATLIWGTDWANRDLVRIISWALVAGTMWWRVALLFTTGRPRPRHRETPPAVPPGERDSTLD
jgi:hypothetical protein